MDYKAELDKISKAIQEHKANSKNIIFVKMTIRFYHRLCIAVGRNVHYIEGVHVVIDNAVDDWQLY